MLFFFKVKRELLHSTCLSTLSPDIKSLCGRFVLQVSSARGVPRQQRELLHQREEADACVADRNTGH